MSDKGIHFTGENLSDKMRRNREELMTLTFARDYGFKATAFAHKALGDVNFFGGIAEQRAQARLEGNIKMDEQGNEHFTGVVDLAKLGLNPEQIAHVATLATEEKAAHQPVITAPADPRDAVSETIKMRADGHDLDGEGYGVRRVQPRPPVEPVGRVNKDGSSMGQGQ